MGSQMDGVRLSARSIDLVDPVHFPSVFFSELCVDSAGDVRTDPEYR